VGVVVFVLAAAVAMVVVAVEFAAQYQQGCAVWVADSNMSLAWLLAAILVPRGAILVPRGAIRFASRKVRVC
jgi:hypothetical protein